MKGIVLYSDGGVKPNPGMAGYGVHGYIFETTTPTKGVGLGSIVPCTIGYTEKDKLTDIKPEDALISKSIVDELYNFQVTPIKYIDAFGTVDTLIDGQYLVAPTSNNHAEIRAVIRALEIIAEHKPDFAFINSDSELVVRGTNEWLKLWNDQKWVKRDGSPVANTAAWQTLYEAKKVVDDLGIPFRLKWIRGHDGDTGNERADKLATIGRFSALRGVTYHECVLKETEGYWKQKLEKNPLLLNRYCYFNTNKETMIPGVYYLGNHGKNHSHNGNRISDRSGCVVKIKTPDPVIEMIREYQSKTIYGLDMLYVINLDKVFNSNTYDELNTYGELLIEPPMNFRKDLKTLGDVTITEEQNPAKLSQRTLSSLEELQQVLDSFLNKKEDVIVTDITDIFYEKSIKTKNKKNVEESVQTETKLHSSVGVGCPSIKINGRFNKDGNDTILSVTLNIGIDTLERNSLKKIETCDPKIYFVSWSDGGSLFRYATVIQTKDDVGIWAGIDSNTRIITIKQ